MLHQCGGHIWVYNEPANYRVLSARDGGEALVLFEQHRAEVDLSSRTSSCRA
jgi:hypothetical protein